jgi:hypothetical protein
MVAVSEGKLMFWSKTPEFDTEQEQADERPDRERAKYWKMRFSQANSEQETTRVFIEYRQDLLVEWLKDFDRRLALEMRYHTRTVRHTVIAVGAVLVVLHWL